MTKASTTLNILLKIFYLRFFIASVPLLRQIRNFDVDKKYFSALTGELMWRYAVKSEKQLDLGLSQFSMKRF
jgi:hypothetical protein